MSVIIKMEKPKACKTCILKKRMRLCPFDNYNTDKCPLKENEEGETIIKGMPMPWRCGVCKIESWDGYHRCPLINGKNGCVSTEQYRKKGRHPKCLLKNPQK